MLKSLSFLALCFSMLFVVSIEAKADPKDVLFRMKLARHFDELLKAPDTTEKGWFTQRLNHADPNDHRTFKQRYFINSSFAKGPQSPVFYVICGEGTCEDYVFHGSITKWAEKFNARLVALEHRFYGKSQPFSKLTTENLRYLSTPFALVDLAQFQRHAMEKFGFRGKWVAIGGSYSGSLAAYYRQKFPNLVVGALASSGPVEAHANFAEFDQTVTHTVGKECAEAMRKAVRAVESVLDNPEKLAKVKAMFDSSDIKDNIDFLYVIADMGAFAAQYGFHPKFCETVTSGDPLQGYAKAGTALFKEFGLRPIEDTPQAAMSLDPKDYLKFAVRQWTYQVCTEYGYYQVAHPDPAQSVRSSLIDRRYHDKMCYRIFGIKKPVNTKPINKTFYEPLLNARKASNIYYTNGSLDPWSRLSISKERGNDVNPKTLAFTIKDSTHCEDLGDRSTPELDQARAIFEKLLTKWL